MIRRDQMRRRSPFTLIELLVVVAIIGILAAMLLGAISKVKRKAVLVDCLNHVKQLSLAVQGYANSNDDFTPPGAYNNKSGISPKARGAAPGTPITSGTYAGMTVWNSIGALIKDDMPADPQTFYRCPAAPGTPDDAWAYGGTNPLSGFAADDVWVSNYFYMSTGVWITTASNTSWYPQVWATRNIANLRLGVVKDPTVASTWVDESTSHHTGSDDIYNRNTAMVRARDFSNFGFLDGHAATQEFVDLRGYLTALGPPIPQGQFGIDFTSTAAWPLTETLPAAIN